MREEALHCGRIGPGGKDKFQCFSPVFDMVDLVFKDAFLEQPQAAWDAELTEQELAANVQRSYAS